MSSRSVMMIGMADEIMIDDRQCPDGGRCHHECSLDECYRVRGCGPLIAAGYEPKDRWPVRVRRAFALPDQSVASPAGGINLNNYVWVRLTEHGEAIFARWYEGLRLDPTSYRAGIEAGGGFQRMQAWELMHIFGPFMSMGMGSPFEEMTMWTVLPVGADR